MIHQDEFLAKPMEEQSIAPVYSDAVTISVSHATVSIVFKVAEPWNPPNGASRGARSDEPDPVQVAESGYIATC